ncbi:hypothetical protein GE09DRAFT_1209591 [Coniochaeta sp. 2T2.1]|nr:hypothetical protein GE09DRAFT_1209591 [Coniochaeta sp. 2T2.1]
MAYFNPRPTLPTYYDVSAAGQQQGMTVPSYDTYAVAPLSIPTNGPPVGGPVGGSSLPPQHRASSGAWNTSDDQTLLAARAAGQNWSQIQVNYFPTKTGNACRKRHERLMERKGADDWDTRKLERLSKEYMAMRKEIWQPLAQRCGEKWNVVEQKCMSNGLKNIQSHARAHSRRERLESGQPMTGYDDDSGISGIGLTPVDDMDHEHNSYSASPETTSSSGGGGGGGVAGGNHHSSSVGSSTGSSTASAHGYSTAMQSQNSYQGYNTYGAPTGPHHGYNSSVSSSGTAGYGAQHGGHHSPYMGHGNRMPSVDMGIDAIIHRGPGGGGHQGV